MIRSAHAAQDFAYPAVADFIRAALQAYKEGMVLTELDQNGPKVETSLRMDRELWQFYKSLPNRMRPKILERVIRTFVKHTLGGGGGGVRACKRKVCLTQRRLNPRRYAAGKPFHACLVDWLAGVRLAQIQRETCHQSACRIPLRTPPRLMRPMSKP